jgi:Phosphotransferase enzyme family
MPSEPLDLQIFDLLSSGSVLHRVISQHADVTILRVRTGGGYSLVSVKHLRLTGPRAKQSIQNEFLTLQKLQTVLGEPLSRTIPRPMLFLEREGTIVFSFVPGVPLDRLLRRDANALTARLNPLGRRRLESCGFRIGEWLRAFHDATAGDDQPFDHARFSAELDSLLAKCQTVGLSSTAMVTLREVALSLSASASGTAVPTAATHGDFLPQNVLLEGGQPRVIDFASFCSSGPVYTDLAHFVAYLGILSRKPRYSRKTVEAVSRRFLSGYGRVLNPSVLRMYVVRSMLRITADGDRKRASGFVETTLDLLSSILNNKDTGLIPA